MTFEMAITLLAEGTSGSVRRGSPDPAVRPFVRRGSPDPAVRPFVRRGSPDPAVRPTEGLQVTRRRSGTAVAEDGRVRRPCPNQLGAHRPVIPYLFLPHCCRRRPRSRTRPPG